MASSNGCLSSTCPLKGCKINPGLEAPDSQAAPALFYLTPAVEQISMAQILVMLLPQSPQAVADLTTLCAKTPSTPPWSGFRGTTQRYRYLHHNKRLKKIGQDLACLQLNAPTLMTEEKSVFIAQLRRQLQAEQARITELSRNLWWPFHRASIQFFATLQQGITDKLSYLDRLYQTDKPFQTELSPSVLESKQVIAQEVRRAPDAERVILPAAQEQKETSAQKIQASLARGEAILAQARETTRELEKRLIAAATEQSVCEVLANAPLASAESETKSLDVHQPAAAKTFLLSLSYEKVPTENPIKTQPPESKKPLSSATRGRLVEMCAYYNQLTPEESNKFAVWQQNCFGRIFFNGFSFDSITEEEGTVLSDLWISFRIEGLQNSILGYEATEQRFWNNFNLGGN